MTDDIEFRIAKLEVKTGDILVAKFDARLVVQQVEHIQKVFKDKLPEGVKVLVSEGGCDLAILSFEEIQRRAKLAGAA